MFDIIKLDTNYLLRRVLTMLKLKQSIRYTIITLFALAKLVKFRRKKTLNKKLKLVLSYNLSYIDTCKHFKTGFFTCLYNASYKYFEIILNYSFFRSV